MMKKPAFLLFIALLLSLLFTAAAAETSGDFDYEVLEDGTVSITKYNGSGSQLEIPETLDGRIVTNLGDYILDSSNVTSISIPDTVTEIQGNPFRDNSSLNQILVTENHPTLATIDGVLFSKPDKRLICYPPARTDSSYEIPQGIQIIGEEAFYASNLKSLSIPDSVTHIDNLAFEFCDALTSITLPDGITAMGDNPFATCESLTSICITDNNLSLATINGALYDKKDKRLIWYPMSRNDTSFTIPNGITSIGSMAFNGCSKLTSISIPDSVSSIGMGAFYDCYELASITIPEGVTTIEEFTFYSCYSLSSISISASVTSISEYAFSGCENLTITASEGSYAHQFAQEHGIPFTAAAGGYRETTSTDWLNQ